MKLPKSLLMLCLMQYPLTAPAQASGCDQDGKSLASALYAIAMTHPDNLPNEVSKNRQFFVPNRQWRICFDHIADGLMTGAVAGPSVNRIRDRAYDVASRSGVPQMRWIPWMVPGWWPAWTRRLGIAAW